MSLQNSKWVLCGMCLWALLACSRAGEEPAAVRDLPQIIESGELRAITIENSL